MYLPATLTPKNTWQDSAQTILNTNPIVLDSRGEAIIYGTGDYRQIVKDVDGNLIWDQEIVNFQSSVFGPQDTITAATTTDLGSVASNNILVQGTTTINSFGTSASLANPVYLLQFANITTLTYNATSMILPGAANLTTAANDSALVEFINAAGYWRMIAYFSSASGGALGTAATKNIGTSGANVPLLSGNNTWGGIQKFGAQTYGVEVSLVGVGTTATPDFALGNYFLATFGATGGPPFTIENPLNVQPGQSGLFRINQIAAGVSIAWGTSYVAPGGIGTITLTGLLNAIDYYAFYAHSATEIVITPILNVTH